MTTTWLCDSDAAASPRRHSVCAMSHAPAGAASASGERAAAAAAADDGDAGAMDEGTPPVSARQQKGPARGLTPAEAAAAAAAHRDSMLAAMRRERPVRPFKQLDSSEQVVRLDEGELWPTIVAEWCRPGEERIEEFAATWEGDDLAAIVYHLGLTVKPRNGRRDYWERAMRQQIIDAVRKYAGDHPELFEPEAASDADGASECKAASSPRAGPVRGPPLQHHGDRRPASPEKGRRSPRATPASRSADAMRALGELPLVGRALERAERVSPEQRKEASRSPPQARGRSEHHAQAARRPVRLLDLGDASGDSSPSSAGSDNDDDADSDWALDDDDAAASASARRGGRLLRDEFDSRLAESGVQRHSFATGFLRNAMREAAGRTLYQLYKDATAQWDGASVHCKREALAHARTLDSLLQAPRGSRAVRDALEHVCRRLGGVHTAATTGSWEMCDRLEAQTSTHSFVPDYFMAAALKQVTREQAIRKSVADGQRGGSMKNSRTQGTGRKPRDGSAGMGPSSGGSNGAAGGSVDQPGAGSSSHKKGGGKTGSRKK